MPDGGPDGAAPVPEAARIPKPPDQLRIRAAWLYYVEGMTQSDVAAKLGVNRIMVNRLLSEARRRGEVVIRIESELAELTRLQRALEERFGLDEAVVAPLEDPADDPTRVVAAAAGAHVSGLMRGGLTVGVGWGRTLHAMLPYVEERALPDVRVVSLLGSIAQARRFNPAEFAWQFAERFEAEGYLISAPAVVNSPETRRALLEECGLDRILELAEACDVALFSCGGISTLTTSYRSGHIGAADRESLVAAGAVGDVLYHFLGADGRPVDHPVNARSISLPLEHLSRLPRKVLVSGGAEKLAILRATLLSVAPTVFVTDEATARALLKGAPAAEG